MYSLKANEKAKSGGDIDNTHKWQIIPRIYNELLKKKKKTSIQNRQEIWRSNSKKRKLYMAGKCKEMVSSTSEQENSNQDHNDTAISLAKI